MTLTEQWKNGELERGRYYIKYRGNYMSDNWHGDCWEDSWSEYVEEVLAPVPSYVEWKNVTTCFDYEHKAYLSMVEENQQLRKWCEEFNALDVAKENQQLKELLKEIRSLWKGTICMPDSQEQVRDILTKIDNTIGEKK